MGVPLNPDSSPKLGGTTGQPVPVDAGAAKIWGIPTELTDYLNQVGTGGKLFFDVGQHKVKHGGTSGPVIYSGDGDIKVGAAKPVSVPASIKTEAYNVMLKPWQVMAQIQASSYNNPALFVSIQNALAQSGAFGTVHINGTFDQATQNAIAQAMIAYVKLSVGTEAVPEYQDPKTGKKSSGFVAFILNAAQRGKALGVNQPAVPPKPTLTVTDPAAIRSQIQNAAQTALGRGLSEEQINAFVTQFQNEQKHAELAGPGATAVQPDLSSEAGKFAQQANPGAYKANQRQAFVDSLVNLLGGTNARPTITPTPAAM